MTTFYVRASLAGFPPTAGLATSTTLTITDGDLAHALFVTGRAPGDEARHGLASYWEFVHRVSLVPAYVRRTATGRLTRSALARELDRSEKINLSYALGQAFSAVFCQQVLGVDRLLHIDRYCQHHNVRFGPGKQRPDLFGAGSSGWVVAEAKGRSNAMERGLSAKLRSQKSIVRTINGADPWLRVGTVSEFPPPSRVLRVRAIDPADTTKSPESWRVDDDLAALAYYEPFLRLLDAGDDVPSGDDRDGPLVTTSLGPVGVRVSILRSVVALVAQASREGVPGLAARIEAALRATDGDVRRDGTVFETTWSDSLALRDFDS